MARIPKNEPLEPDRLKVEWNADAKEFSVTMFYEDGKAVLGTRIDTVAVVRIRETGHEWGPGFVTPLSGHKFSGLKPDTEYEVAVSHMNDAGEGPMSPPAVVRTDPEGRLS